MNTKRTSVGTSGATIVIDDESRETVESQPGRPDVHRFFSDGPVVVAASSQPTVLAADEAVERAIDSLLGAYADRPSYALLSNVDADVHGARRSSVVDFSWQDRGGVDMRSVAVVAADANETVVVHGTLPSLHGPGPLQGLRNTVLSCTMGPADVTASP